MRQDSRMRTRNGDFAGSPPRLQRGRPQRRRNAVSIGGPRPLLRRAGGDRAARPRAGAAGRARGRRPLGLRQVHPAGADRRPARALRRGVAWAVPATPTSASPAAPTCRSATCCCPGSRRSTTPRWRCATAASPGPRGAPRAGAVRALRPRGLRARRPAQLSGGMRQRVAFLRTPVAGKPVLLLDEPFASLDAITRAEMQEWLAGALRADPRTAVLVTHDVEEALYLCDQVAVLSSRPARIAAKLTVADPRAPDRDEPSPRPPSSSCASGRWPRCGRGRGEALDPPRPRPGRAARRLADRRQQRGDRSALHLEDFLVPVALARSPRCCGRTARCSPTTPG